MTRIAELQDRLRRLAKRREGEGIYTDAAICEEAAEALSRTGAVKAALSGDTGELIDRMAAAIRDWGSHYDDGPWETLPEDRKAGWRGDAERALAVVKEYLTARRPAEQAVTEAKPFAFCVHDFHVARMPVKARGKFEEPTEYYYPASRENDARETARLMGATCTPLYAGKESA